MTLIEGLYYIGYSIKKHQALKNQRKLPCKVLSIGNITVGGTGKTPATIAIAEEAKKRGFIPNILTRGYKGKKRGPCFVSKGDGPLLGEEDAGDEPLLMANRLKGVPIIKGENRYEAGMFALSSLPLSLHPDTFILDDGFQHWNLFRDKDILLIDGTNPFGNRKLLPLGPLREPLSAIGRADIIAITKTVGTLKSVVTPAPPFPSRGEGEEGGNRSQRSINSLIKEIRQHNKRALIFFAEHRPAKFTTASADTFPLEWAKEKKFFGFAGIGKPESFKKTLLSIGTDLRGFRSYRDHYRYNSRDIGKITKDAKNSGVDWIVTTEKDIMRLRGLNIPENLIALAIEFSVEEGFYDEVFREMQNGKFKI
jgi:tetraacyldisaccharide 4'-kinase